MKYYSELLNKNYDSAEECEAAEKEEQTRLAEVEKKETALANEKKKFAADIEKAEEELNIAYDKLEAARTQARELKDEFEKKVEELHKEMLGKQNDILRPAKEEVEKAQQKKFNAIQAFSEKYGWYTKRYDGNKAIEEYNRITRTVNNWFKNFWLF